MKKKADIPSVIIYTDGSANNVYDGGWAASIYWQDQALHLTGNELNTTNNRMELLAVIEALSALIVPCNVELYSDSKYVLTGIEGYVYTWEKNGWRSSSGTPVANVDLWQRLLPLLKIHNLSCFWVHGHQGNVRNEIVDSLAVTTRKQLSESNLY